MGGAGVKRKKVISCRGADWTIELWDSQVFGDAFGKATAAVTLGLHPQRRVIFQTDDTTIQTVRHEMFHVYCNELLVGSADLKLSQFEEIMAESFAEWLPDMAKQIRAVYVFLNKNKRK